MWVCTQLKETNNKRKVQFHFNSHSPNRKHMLLVASKWLSLSVPDTVIFTKNNNKSVRRKLNYMEINSV